MTRYVCWLRGINVGGKHKLPMAELRELLAAAGYSDIATYIQSGNVALTAEAGVDAVQTDVARRIEDTAAFPVPVVAVTADELAAIEAANPWRDATPKLCHIIFYASPLTEEQRGKAHGLATEGDDELAVGERVIYLHTPGGLSSTKTAARLDRAVPGGTARNLATVAKMLELAAH